MKQASPTLTVIAALLVVLTAAPAGEPMHDEDVVRMFVTGATEDEIIAKIRSSETDFDLSDEMLAEMRIAGLPEGVLQAMIDRQREQAGGPEEDAAAEEATVLQDAPVTARVVFLPEVHIDDAGGKRKAPFLRFPARATPGMVKTFELGTGEEDIAVTSAAYFVACTTAEHVPDHWRNKSPIGRDFIRMPRHRMLSFHPDFELLAPPPEEEAAGEAVEEAEKPDEPAKQKKRKKKDRGQDQPQEPAGGGGKKHGKIRLQLPESLSVELQPGVRHDLLIGVAVEIGGRYYMILGGEVADVDPDTGGERRYRVRIDAEYRTGFRMEITVAPDTENSNPD